METRMKYDRILLALLLAGGLAACGDDSDGSGETGETDTGVDTGAGDTGETDTGETDAGEDTGGGGEDTSTDPEICDDGIDNDEDGDIDCDDSDCETAEPCLVDPEICDDGIDNDEDGAIDCDDSDCALDADACPTGECEPACEGDQECIGGGCVDPQTVDTYEPADLWSYLSRLQVPENGSDVECCYNFDSDPEIDNNLDDLLPLVASLAGDVQVLIDDAFADGSIVLLAEYREWPETVPGDARLHFWLGTNDLDGDGENDQDYDTELAAGMGTFRAENESFSDYGSFIQFNAATWDGSMLATEPSIFRLSIPLAGLIDGLDDFTITLEILAARIEADLDGDSPTTSVNVESADDGETYGGAKLGGVLPLDQIFGQLDEVLRTCTCAAEIDGSSPVIVYGDEPGPRYSVACAEPAYDTSACEDQICGEILPQLCSFAGVVANLPLADIDTNGNGVFDAISVGARITMVDAMIDADSWIEVEE